MALRALLLCVCCVLAASASVSRALPEATVLGMVKKFSTELTETGALPALIPGSRFESIEEVKAFRRRWDCLCSRSNFCWQLDPTPRIVPWAEAAVLLGRFQNMGVLSGSAINQAVRDGAYSDPKKWPVPQYTKYNWVPRQGKEKFCGSPAPSFGSLNVPQFCDALRRSNGSLFVVGDSLSATFVGALVAEFSAQREPIRVLDPTPACQGFLSSLLATGDRSLQPGSWKPCGRWMVCGDDEASGGVILHYTISCHLQWIHGNVPRKPYGGSPWCRNLDKWYWGEEMVRVNASVVLLNRGMHFVGKEDFQSQLNYTLHEVRSMVPNALTVFWSSVPGHPNCSNYQDPVDSPVDLSNAPYHWNDVVEENGIAKALIESVGGVFLDVHQMNSLRPDGHLYPEQNRDCLHYRLPGPPSTWPRFFASMLSEAV